VINNLYGLPKTQVERSVDHTLPEQEFAVKKLLENHSPDEDLENVTPKKDCEQPSNLKLGIFLEKIAEG